MCVLNIIIHKNNDNKRNGNNGKYKMYLPNDIAYTIVAIDKNKQYNAVVQDNVVSK